MGFVASYRRYVLTRFLEHFGAIAHRSPSPFLVILHFPQILDGVDTAGRYCKTEHAGTKDSDGCIRISRDSPKSISEGFNAISPTVYTSVVRHWRARHNVRPQFDSLGAKSAQSWQETEEWIVFAR